MSPKKSTILTNIANARAGVLAAGSDHASNINANSKLDVALGPFFRLQEQYPDLKGNQQFMRLTDELAGTENRIAVDADGTTRRCRTITSTSGSFPTVSGLILPAFITGTNTSRVIRRTMWRRRSTSRSRRSELTWAHKKAAADATAFLLHVTKDYLLCERRDCGCLVILDVEDSVEFRDLQ